MVPKLCVCILNYNNSRSTIACIESLLNQDFPVFMLITDNASTDDSMNEIKEFLGSKNILFSVKKQNNDLELSPGEASEAVLLQSLKNGGFSYGNNLSLEFVHRNKGFTHILLLNNDVILQDNFLKEITSAYEVLSGAHPSGPIALGATEKGTDGKFHHTGIHYLNILTGLVFARPVFPSFRYIVGACLFLPADAPLMDDGYFLYYDDAEYSKILLKHHFILDRSEKAVYLHDIGATTRNDPGLYKIIFRSMKRFYMKNYPLAYPFVIFFRFLLDLVRGRFAIALEILKSAFRPV